VVLELVRIARAAGEQDTSALPVRQSDDRSDRPTNDIDEVSQRELPRRESATLSQHTHRGCSPNQLLERKEMSVCLGRRAG